MVIVFGSINMDIVFNTQRFPEAGETLLLNDYSTFPGGKGANQAVAASRMRSETYFAGCVGQDGFADELLGIIKREGVKADFTCQVAGKTGTAMIVVEANGENRILVAAGANLQARADQLNDDILKNQTVLMQMETDPAEVKALALRAHSLAKNVILNLAPAIPVDGETLDHIDMLILNQIEICQLAQHLGHDVSTGFEDVAADLARRHDMTCVITLGEDGAIAFGPDGQVSATAKSLKIDQVVDTTGAGDAFCGTMAAGLDQGMTLQAAMEFACVAGSLACLKAGAMASYPTRDEVQNALSAVKPMSARIA